MRKTLLLTLACTIALVPAFAGDKNKTKSSKMYFRAGGTYAFGAGGAYNYLTSVPISGKGTSVAGYPNALKLDINKASYSAGLWTNLALGFMFNKHLGVELAVNTGVSTKKYKYSEDFAGITATRTSYVKLPTIIAPALVMQTGGKCRIYTRLGLAIPIAAKVTVEDYAFAWPSSLTNNKEVKNGFSLGFTTAAGLKYALTDGIDAYIEASGLFLKLKSKSAEVVELNSSGRDVLSELTVAEREAVFSEQFTIGSPNQDPNQPTVLAPQSAPFSNVGIALGISFDL